MWPGTMLLMGVLAVAVHGQGQMCVLHETCGKCLSADQSCTWCVDRDYDMRKPRCFAKHDSIASNCQHSYTNQASPVQLLDNRPAQDFSAGQMEAVQIQPQRVQMKLKKLQTKMVKMTYRPAKNYPLDLYYLMDMTFSMTDDKETLVHTGMNLAETLRTLTENYRMGFGSFVDKPTMPFMPIGKEAENPCALERAVCEKTYGFKHQLSFTENMTQFVLNVNETKISGNLDNLEGGLDALMQVLVCGSNIGWLTQSRKIVIFASDGLMHFAGDGLLAGVIKKNDKQCHLSETGDYMSSLELDYPSLEEIYRELLKQKINVIFAVTQDVQELYHQIHSLMQEVSSVGILKMDSSNVQQLVADGFADFVRKVQFSDNAPAHLQVRYETTCGGLYDRLHDTAKCDNVDIGKEYEFLVYVTLLDYPKDVAANQTSSSSIKVEEASISSEFMQIEVDIEPECVCLSQEVGEVQSNMCNRHGELKCGMCQCESGWAGKSCECDLLDYGSSKELEHQCRLPLSDTDSMGPICADHGECICGQCDCNYGFTGKYCNCLPCPFYQGVECGKSPHATCDCGQCKCDAGWSGDRCDCPAANDTCFAPNAEKMCSGQGECICGRCACAATFYGAFCESSSLGVNSLCAYYEPCVHCRLLQKEGIDCTDRCEDTSGTAFLVNFNDDIAESNLSCVVRITNDENRSCDYRYVYEVNEGQQSRLDIRYKKCVHVNYGAAGGLIFLATILLGLMVLVTVKVANVVQDRREFSRFEEERKNATRYEYESPIYNSPNRRYEVPDSLAGNDFEMKSF